MKKIIIAGMLSLTFTSSMAFHGVGDSVVIKQDPRVQAEIDAFGVHYSKQNPGSTNETLSRGSYSFNEDKLMQFEDLMEMPPFEDSLDKGESIWNKAFANGKTFASCFSMKPEQIRTSFPRWNSKTKKVETLEAQVNKCRVDNGEKPWGYKKGNIAFVSSYLNSIAAGSKINVIVPEGDEDAFEAWNDGKKTFYTKRGQLNLSCADCHAYSAGKWIRGNILSPAKGHVTHFPVWRGKWAKSSNGYGTLQRRYGGCYKQVRAQPAKTQGKEYTNLEFFHTSMSNGMDYVGPEYRE